MPATKPKHGFFFAVGCPACGGELELQTDFLTTTCSYCGSILRVVVPPVPPAYLIRSKIKEREVRFHVDRHLKENGLPLTDTVAGVQGFYYPYWKIDGILLRLRQRTETRYIYHEDYGTDTGEEERKVERKLETTLSRFSVTLAASTEIRGVPHDIGERAEYVKTLPFGDDAIQDGFLPLAPSIPMDEALQAAAKSVKNLNHIDAADFGANRSQLFRPTVSIVFFPYLLLRSRRDGAYGGFVVDGVTGRVLESLATAEEFDLPSPPPSNQQQFGQLGVELHRCRNCGEQLPDHKSYVYICRNCRQTSFLETHPRMRREVNAACGGKSGNDTMFPFWSFRFGENDGAQISRIVGATSDSEQLAIPAFRLPNFEAMYKLCRRISAAMPSLKMSLPDMLDDNYLPVTVGISEGIAIIGAIFAREKMGRGDYSDVESQELSAEDISLFFAPFRADNYFYVDSVLGAVTFERAQVSAT